MSFTNKHHIKTKIKILGSIIGNSKLYTIVYKSIEYGPEFKSRAFKSAVIFAAFGATVGAPSAKTFKDIKGKKQNKK